MGKIPERNKGYKEGLINFVHWIDNRIPVKDLTILEIGAWTGAGTEIFANRFKQVYCIDPWKKDEKDSLTVRFNVKVAEKIFDKRMQRRNNVFKLKGDFRNYVNMFKEQEKYFDVVYIDMNKLFEDNVECLKSYLPLTLKYISGHDYEIRFMGVVNAVNKVIGKPDKIFKDKSWIKFIGDKINNFN